MPNQRAKDQTLIAFALDAELARGLDNARKLKRQNRSEFIRDAIVAEVKRQGIALPEDIALAPDRTRVQRYPSRPDQAAMLNEKANSATKQTEKGAVAKAVNDAKKPGVVYGRSRKAGRTSGKTS